MFWGFAMQTYEINEMYAFTHSKATNQRKKSKSIVWQDIGMFFVELGMSMLPIFIVWLITLLINNASFSLTSFFVDGEFLWFSITTLALLNVKTLLAPQKNEKGKKSISVAIVFSMLLFSGIYVFLQLVSLKIINVALNVCAVVAYVLLFTTVTIIINIISIVSKEG